MSNNIDIETVIYYLRPIQAFNPNIGISEKRYVCEFEFEHNYYANGIIVDTETKMVTLGNFKVLHKYVVNGINDNIDKQCMYTVTHLIHDLLPLVGKGYKFLYDYITIEHNIILMHMHITTIT